MNIYSYSKLNSFKNCPYQYKLKYIDFVKIERETIERFLGNTVHSTLEYLYKDIKADKSRSVDSVVKLYQWFWDKNFNSKIIIVKKQYNFNHYRETGEKCIKKYYDKHYPFNKNEIIGLEEKIYIKIDDSNKYLLTGVVDRIDETPNGDIEIHDYKTGMRLPTQKAIEEEEQLSLYHLGVKDALGCNSKQIKLIWHYLMFDQEFVLSKTDEKLNEVKSKTVKIIEEIENTKDFGTIKGPLCNYCEYYEEVCKY
ncbi:MAG: PD-(D/E)XK nuclease family protein [Candidatus Firestonebacteria bacterium]